MKKIIIIIILGNCIFHCFCQNTLEDCQKWAMENYPAIQQYSLISQSTEYSVSNAKRQWLPQISLSAQATYQSDVSSFPDNMMALYQAVGIDIHGLNKDQYKLTLDVSQTIWDGGINSAKQTMAETEGKVQELKVKTEIYAINARINAIFFGILLLDEQRRQNELLQQMLESNIERVKGAIDGGVAMLCDQQMLEAELLQARQGNTKIAASREAYLNMLGVLTGHNIDSLALPAEPFSSFSENHRPELELLNWQKSNLEAQIKVINASVHPYIGAFAQGFYGNPGMNLFRDMTENKWTLNGIVGIKLQWNISNFYTRQGNLQKVELARQQIEVQRNTFLFNSNLKTMEQQNSIRQMREIMKQDREIIALLQSVREAYEAKLENGVANVNDLLRQITSENQARIRESEHRIELLKYLYDLKIETGN